MAYFASIVIIPVISALFLAILLTPVVDRISRAGINRGVAAAGVLASCLLAAGALGWLAYLSAYELSATLPANIERLKTIGAGVYHTIERLEFAGSLAAPASLPPGVSRVQVVESFPAWTQYLVRGVGSFYEVAVMAIFIPMLLLYF
ncbi:MAG: AI-2E family transporter, partial [Proteobacteria bacterium]